MKLISAHDVSVFRDILQNIGQTSGRILLEIESEVPLSKKEEKKESKHISFNVYLTDHIPLYFQTSILDTNNIKGKVMLKIEMIYQADLRVCRLITTPMDMSWNDKNEVIIYAKVFLLLFTRPILCDLIIYIVGK